MMAIPVGAGRMYNEAVDYKRGNRDNASMRLRHPQTHEEWVARYNWLSDAYMGNAYSESDMIALGLFRAIDPNGEIILETRRLTRDVQHVVDTDAQALAAHALSLETSLPDAVEIRDAGKAIWKRSRFKSAAGRWARWGASMGDCFLEAARQEDGTVKIIGYNPVHVRVEYDIESSTIIDRAVISIPYYEAPEINSSGEALGDEVLHTYVRILDDTNVTVYEDGEINEKASGPHGLGVVPLVHLPFVPYIDVEHGEWAALGLDSCLALVDSLLTQIQAIGNRYANPILVAIGAKIGADSDILKFGRIVSGIPGGGDLKFVESSLNQINTLLDAAQRAREMARETLPEFLFSESGANSSGSALNFRAAAFVAKMDEIRGRWYRGFATVTQYAYEMENNTSHDESIDLYVVKAPPVLPVNIESDLKAVLDSKEAGGLLKRDFVTHLQRLQIVPQDVDAQEYADELDARAPSLQPATQIPNVDSVSDDSDEDDTMSEGSEPFDNLSE